MNNLLLIILGMAAVTYGPRLMPFLFLSSKTISPPPECILKAIPVAALGALIVPGVFQATPEVPFAAVVGMGFTILYGLYRGGIIIPVLGSVAVTYFFLLASA